MGVSLIKALIDKIIQYKKKRECKILFLGLDNAGKTTILYHLLNNETIPTIPTIGFNVERLSIGKNTAVC